MYMTRLSSLQTLLFGALFGAFFAHTGAFAAGVSAEQLQACLTMPGDAARLACYIRITPPNQPPANAIDHPAPLPRIPAPTHAGREGLRDAILEHLDPSYITASSGVRLGSDKSPSNLLYEAQINENIAIYDSVSRGRADNFWLDAPVRLAVRQLTEASLPVRTPSFNPGLRLTWAPQSRLNQYYSLGLYHYSNGQDGDGTLPDGSLNTSSGTFNTNYLELTANQRYLSGRGPLEWSKVAFRNHFYGTFEPYQRDQYPRHQLIVGLHSIPFKFTSPILPSLFNTEVQLRLTGIIGSGYRYVVKNDVTPGKTTEARFSDRLNTRLEVLTKVKLIAQLQLYLRYDYGYDYYNIHFQQRINRFQIGVAALSE
jgi:hypothetical protein